MKVRVLISGLLLLFSSLVSAFSEFNYDAYNNGSIVISIPVEGYKYSTFFPSENRNLLSVFHLKVKKESPKEPYFLIEMRGEVEANLSGVRPYFLDVSDKTEERYKNYAVLKVTNPVTNKPEELYLCTDDKSRVFIYQFQEERAEDIQPTKEGIPQRRLDGIFKLVGYNEEQKADIPKGETVCFAVTTWLKNGCFYVVGNGQVLFYDAVMQDGKIDLTLKQTQKLSSTSGKVSGANTNIGYDDENNRKLFLDILFSPQKDTPKKMRSIMRGFNVEVHTNIGIKPEMQSFMLNDDGSIIVGAGEPREEIRSLQELIGRSCCDQWDKTMMGDWSGLVSNVPMQVHYNLKSGFGLFDNSNPLSPQFVCRLHHSNMALISSGELIDQAIPGHWVKESAIDTVDKVGDRDKEFKNFPMVKAGDGVYEKVNVLKYKRFHNRLGQVSTCYPQTAGFDQAVLGVEGEGVTIESGPKWKEQKKEFINNPEEKYKKIEKITPFILWTKVSLLHLNDRSKMPASNNDMRHDLGEVEHFEAGRFEDSFSHAIDLSIDFAE